MGTAESAFESIYIVPGGGSWTASAIQQVPCDTVIFDLESLTPPLNKARARERVCAALQGGGFGVRRIAVRVNPLTTRWGYDDLVAVATSRTHAVLLSMINGADAVRDAEQVLLGAGAPDDIAIWCMIRTPRAVLNAAQIAAASPRVGLLVMGFTLLTRDLGAGKTRDRIAFVTSLGLGVLGARVSGVAMISSDQLRLYQDSGG